MAAAPATAGDFLALTRKSGLVEKSSLEKYIAEKQKAAGLPGEPAKLAALFVKDGVLTPFQAENLLRGKCTGLTLGKYKILKRIGSGGMGAVYLAEHLNMRRTVALKVLPADKAKDPACLGRFHREAQAAAALNHPNIVRAYDVCQEGKTCFLVMEYVEGVNLQDVVQKQGPLDVALAAEIVRQVAAGLDHAHRAGLVHRDIKPANILVSGMASGNAPDRTEKRQSTTPHSPLTTHQVKILDMGLALFFHDEGDGLTREFESNTVLGTADYLSPEQAVDSHDVDIRADIYSLGATFYFLLAGRPPFAGGNLRQKLVWHQMREPDPVRTHRPEVPESLQAVVTKMMAKSVADRYQTPAEVVQALSSWADTSPAPTSDDGSESPASRPLLTPENWADLIDTVRHDKNPTKRTHPRPDKKTPQDGWLRRWHLAALAGVVLLVVGIWWAVAANSGGDPAGSRGRVPEAPRGLRTADREFGEIELTWESAPDDVKAFRVERANDPAFTQNRTVLGTVPPGTTRFADRPLAAGLPYYYRITAMSAAGPSAPSEVVSPAPAYGSGFSQNGLSLNGGTTVAGTALRLTDASPGVKARSAFYAMPVSVQAFTTTFRFQIAAGANTADGFTFCIQNDEPGIVGAGAGSLGYAGIQKSIAVKFDLSNNKGEGNNSTGLFVNGAVPDNPGSLNLTNTGIDLHNGHAYQVVLEYNKGSLALTITDTVEPKKTFRHTFTIDIPATVGGTTAYCGFTGGTGTGGVGALQDILTWTYSSRS
jgi:serine/threonine protein kinase